MSSNLTNIIEQRRSPVIRGFLTSKRKNFQNLQGFETIFLKKVRFEQEITDKELLKMLEQSVDGINLRQTDSWEMVDYESSSSSILEEGPNKKTINQTEHLKPFNQCELKDSIIERHIDPDEELLPITSNQTQIKKSNFPEQNQRERKRSSISPIQDQKRYSLFSDFRNNYNQTQKYIKIEKLEKTKVNLTLQTSHDQFLNTTLSRNLFGGNTQKAQTTRARENHRYLNSNIQFNDRSKYVNIGKKQRSPISLLLNQNEKQQKSHISFVRKCLTKKHTSELSVEQIQRSQTSHDTRDSSINNTVTRMNTLESQNTSLSRPQLQKIISEKCLSQLHNNRYNKHPWKESKIETADYIQEELKELPPQIGGENTFTKSVQNNMLMKEKVNKFQYQAPLITMLDKQTRLVEYPKPKVNSKPKSSRVPNRVDPLVMSQNQRLKMQIVSILESQRSSVNSLADAILQQFILPVNVQDDNEQYYHDNNNFVN